MIHHIDNENDVKTFPIIGARKIIPIENKFLVVFFWYQAKNKFLVINLHDYEKTEYSSNESVEAFEYFSNSRLVLAGKSITIWDVQKLPFVQLEKINKPFANSITHLLALPKNTLAACATGLGILKFWKSDYTPMNFINLKNAIQNLKYLEEFKIMVFSGQEISFWNYVSGEVLVKFDGVKYIEWSLITFDNQFLVIYMEKKLKFFNISGGYFYGECEAAKIIHGAIHRLKIIENNFLIEDKNNNCLEIMKFKMT